MTDILLGLSFLASILYLPSWAAILIAILYLSRGGNAWLVVIGGFILDELFGAPIASLHGFSYIYTTLALILSFSALYFRKALFE